MKVNQLSYDMLELGDIIYGTGTSNDAFVITELQDNKIRVRSKHGRFFLVSHWNCTCDISVKKFFKKKPKHI